MCVATVVSPPLNFVYPGHVLAAMILGLVGVSVAVAGVVSFRRAKTTVNPMTPGSASTLVVSGIYGLSRNPMYLGIFFVLLGWGCFLGNLLALLGIPGFVLYMNRYQILPEERALAARFGNGYLSYKAHVRRWI